jgi:hypothetical protein
MHKYEEHSVPRGGTDAQDISGSIHMTHLLCMFDLVVRNQCRKMYAVLSHERHRRRCSTPKIQILKFSQTCSKFKMNFKFRFKIFVCKLISTNKL